MSGLQLPPGVQQPRQPDPEDALNQLLVTMTRDIYTTAVSHRLGRSGPPPKPGAFEDLARQCECAAADFVTGLGIAKIDRSRSNGKA